MQTSQTFLVKQANINLAINKVQNKLAAFSQGQFKEQQINWNKWHDLEYRLKAKLWTINMDGWL